MEGLASVQFSYIKRPNHVESHALCSANDVAEGSTQEAHMCASCVLPRKVDRMVWIFSEFGFEENDLCLLGTPYYIG